jgi:hypothetical protein
MPSGIGTLIEFWKVTKAMDVSVSDKFPFLSIKDRVSYSNNPTKEYDRTAMRYLSYALYPLIIGYSIYALMYETHKSWYSWFLGSLVGAVYAFGFILMCPQVRVCGERGGACGGGVWGEGGGRYVEGGGWLSCICCIWGAAHCAVVATETAGGGLMYETHKSWYSWFLGSLVGVVYAFGFILMCPQVCVCGERGGYVEGGFLVVVHLLYLGAGALCFGGH